MSMTRQWIVTGRLGRESLHRAATSADHHGIVRLTAEDVIRLFIRHNSFMPSPSLYHRHRFPAEIISHCVWLYFRFALSFRDVEEMLAMRGVSLSTKQSENGASSSVRPTLTACDAESL